MYVDKQLFLYVSFCIGIGILFSYSLTTFTVLYYEYGDFHFFIRQAISGAVGIFIMWVLSRFDPDKFFVVLGFLIFFLFLGLMAGMHFLPENFVTSAGGAKRWIRLPGFSLAPVEFFKIGFVFFLAWSFTRRIHETKKTLKEEFLILLPYFSLFLLIIFLIAIMQNDLGQVVILALTLASMAFFAGTSGRFFALSLFGTIIVFISAILVSQHRIVRIKTWWSTIQNMVLSFFPDNIANILRVENAPEPYQISHSLNAIKNGGLFGQGIGEGSLKLGFLSEVHTDFVLAGIAEEIGIVGLGVVCFILYLAIYRIFKISSRSDKRLYYLFSLGIGLLIMFSFLMNAFGITSVTPLKGIAVPFISYGGSSLLALCVGVGMVLMISKRAKLS